MYKIVKLQDISESIDYGFTTAAKNLTEGSRLLRITDIQNDSVDWDSVPFCECSEKDIEKYSLKYGDIVFARTGATTGKSFLIRNCPDNSVFASYLIRVRPSKEIDPIFLSRFFQSSSYWHQITQNQTGTTQPGVNSTRLKSLKIPLPPIAEQKRIAEILDKADAVRRKRQEAIRLTEELLRSTFLDMFGDPVTNPKGWDVVKLGSTCHVTKLAGFEYTEHINYKDLAESNDVIALRALNIKNGRLKLDKVKFIDRSTSDKLPRSKLYSGDVVMTYIGVNIGDVAVIEQDDRFHLAPNVAKITPSNLDSLYLVWFLKFQKSQFAKSMTNTAKQALNMSKIRNISLLVPPQDKQKKFACLAESVEAKIANHSAALQESENLFNSLLQRAFRGEL
ncbi:restriction endonuclease subunit S [Baaleninema sp.]|uniref:restriction endonuclease subunit S n=1 Tax=Baaleninema sp. TaxID=3101197 RepID=UPI003D021DFC